LSHAEPGVTDCNPDTCDGHSSGIVRRPTVVTPAKGRGDHGTTSSAVQRSNRSPLAQKGSSTCTTGSDFTSTCRMISSVETVTVGCAVAAVVADPMDLTAAPASNATRVNAAVRRASFFMGTSCLVI